MFTEPRALRLAFVAAGVLLGPAACGPRVVVVGALEPTPTLRLPRQNHRLALVLTPDHHDVVRVETPGYPTIEVRAFRSTLQRGFERGFGSAFTISKGAAAEWKLAIAVRRIAFVTDRDTAVGAGTPGSADGVEAQVLLVHGAHAPKAVSAPKRPRYAALTFRASLTIDGAPAGDLTATVVAEVPARSADRMSASLSSAVELMYERIGLALFARRTALR